MSDYSCRGKFDIRRSVGALSDPFWIQAHLSKYASEKVFNMADRLPELLILDELPRLSVWPFQFIESQPTKKNVDLYFFEKDTSMYV